MSKKGGYVIVDLKGQSITAGTPFTLDGVTARLDRAKNKACLLSGFAIGGEEKRDVFVDLQPTEDGYIAFFGQYTMTIEDDEITIAEGGVLMDDIVDSQGHKRFVEGDVTVTANTFTSTYAKWSLSGTHLMIVVAGSVANTATISSGKIAQMIVPDWVYDKISPIVTDIVEIKGLNFRADDATVQTTYVRLVKTVNRGQLNLNIDASVTMTADRSTRITFDLLIDSDAE